MTRTRFISFWTSFLGCFLVWLTPAYASGSDAALKSDLSIYQPPQARQDPERVLGILTAANVVYLGETHDRPGDHRAQLEIIQALHRHRPDLIIAMEMFQRPYQVALDRYLAGQLDEVGLQGMTQYQKRWGYPWEFYAPILRFAKQNRLPVVALNTPAEVTRRVARVGLEPLTLPERQWIPPKSAIALGPESYRQRLRQLYDEAHQGKGAGLNFERFFLAQVLWDETMAEVIAHTHRKNPTALIVVLAGQGHLLYGDGIPDRVARRMLSPASDQPFRQITIVLNPDEQLMQTSGADVADYFWKDP